MSECPDSWCQWCSWSVSGCRLAWRHSVTLCDCCLATHALSPGWPCVSGDHCRGDTDITEWTETTGMQTMSVTMLPSESCIKRWLISARALPQWADVFVITYFVSGPRSPVSPLAAVTRSEQWAPPGLVTSLSSRPDPPGPDTGHRCWGSAQFLTDFPLPSWELRVHYTLYAPLALCSLLCQCQWYCDPG